MKFKFGDLICYGKEYYRLILEVNLNKGYKVYYINDLFNKNKIGYENYDRILFDVEKVAP